MPPPSFGHEGESVRLRHVIATPLKNEGSNLPFLTANTHLYGSRETRDVSAQGRRMGLLLHGWAGDANEFYKDEMTIYTRENIMNCAELVVRRAKE